MKALRTALERVNESYWADRTEGQMLAVLGWIALKEDICLIPCEEFADLKRAIATYSVSAAR